MAFPDQAIVCPGLDARPGALGIIESGDAGLAVKVELAFTASVPMDLGCVRLNCDKRRS